MYCIAAELQQLQHIAQTAPSETDCSVSRELALLGTELLCGLARVNLGQQLAATVVNDPGSFQLHFDGSP